MNYLIEFATNQPAWFFVTAFCVICLIIAVGIIATASIGSSYHINKQENINAKAYEVRESKGTRKRS